ncbi:DUF1275 family protein [Streptomyces sp. NPDC008150]|uniref:DUF1275 family protein n=1 Tax=Streptomyces sp. NPDC008150 TaxID=3364816 RepID=UPI0036E48B1D
MPVARDRRRRGEWIALILLAGASGAADGLTFLTLGHVFAGVMTGNLVLLGLAFAGTADAVRPLIALGAYAGGAAVAALYARTGGRGVPAPDGGHDAPGAPAPYWPLRLRRVLAAEAVVLGLVGVTWALHGPDSAPWWSCVLLAALAAAMGAQSGALAVSGAPTAGPGTYFTGTLTQLAVRAAGARRSGADLAHLVRLAAVAGGAAAAAGLLTGGLARPAPIVPCVLVLAAVAIVTVTARGIRRPDAEHPPGRTSP